MEQDGGRVRRRGATRPGAHSTAEAALGWKGRQPGETDAGQELVLRVPKDGRAGEGGGGGGERGNEEEEEAEEEAEEEERDRMRMRMRL